METATKPSTLGSILQQRCPRCRIGNIFRYSIFRGFPNMCERCSICDLQFEREPGYFLGAMYISYCLGVLIMAPIAVLLWALTGWWITMKLYTCPRPALNDHTLCPCAMDLS